MQMGSCRAGDAGHRAVPLSASSSSTETKKALLGSTRRVITRSAKVIGVLHCNDANAGLAGELNRAIHRQASCDLAEAVLCVDRSGRWRRLTPLHIRRRRDQPKTQPFQEDRQQIDTLRLMAPDIAPDERLGERLGLFLRYTGRRRQFLTEPHEPFERHPGFACLVPFGGLGYRRHCGHSPRPRRTSRRCSITGDAHSGRSIR